MSQPSRRAFTLQHTLSVLALAVMPSLQAAPPPQMTTFLGRWCMDCHDNDTHKGGLSLEGLDFAATQETHAKWARVYDKVQSGEMPPKNKHRADEAEKSAFTSLLGNGLLQQHSGMKGTVIRRLNRTEYEHTLQDLLGVRTSLKELLPEDGKAYGFDNVGEALDLSSVHIQRYMDAAQAALRDAVKFGPAPEKQTVSGAFDAARNSKSWLKHSDGSMVFFNNGGFPSIVPEFAARAEGIYKVTIIGRSYQTDEDVSFSVYAGTFGRDNDSHLLTVLELPPKQSTRTFEVFLRAREKLRIYPQLVPNQLSLQKDGPAAYKGPGLALMPVEVEGPLIGEWPGIGHKLLFGDLEARGGGTENRGKFGKPSVGEIVSKDPRSDAAKLLGRFVPAAFRRPVTSDKIAPYLKLAEDELASGSSFYEAMMAAYVAVLSSPDFLYLKEPLGRLDDFALASRLSYMIWSSAPDQELLAAASKSQLTTPAGLKAQTERLLNDPRASRFTKNFTGQWLNLREIDFTMPDKQLYPEYSDALKDASMKETELFFEEVLRSNLNTGNFVDSNWTVLNEPLARHYGVEGVSGMEFRKVSLKPEHHRGGVMTQASVLKVSANGTTTSPVVRGIWVLDRILGTPPPPPPPGVPGVEPDIRGAQTLRQQLDKHRTLESCNACHRLIDAPGFALENYDVIGGWRENYRSLGKDFPKPTNVPSYVKNVQWRVGPPVDASGTLASGKSFKDLADFKKIILSQPERVTRSLAEKLAVYGTGRGMGFSDRLELNRIATTVAGKGNGFRDLVHEVIQSALFINK